MSRVWVATTDTRDFFMLVASKTRREIAVYWKYYVTFVS